MRTRTFSFSRSLFDCSRCVLPTHPILPTIVTRRLHKLAQSLRPHPRVCLTVATASDITVCKAKSWLSHLNRPNL